MKYIRIFFTFLGYCTFTAIIGAATFWYIGYKRQQKATESTVQFRDISMTPVATTEAPAEVPPGQLTVPPQVSPSPRKTAPKSGRKTTPVSVRTTPAKPVTMSAPVSVPVSAPEKKFVPSAKKARRTKPMAKTQPATMYPTPQTSTLTFRAEDNRSNPRATPRTGRGINVSETTELEQQVIRDLQLEEIRKAARSIRHPYVWQSGVVEFFSGN